VKVLRIVNVQKEVCVSRSIVNLSEDNQIKLDPMRKAEFKMKNQPGI
jgi:hypothetical protein